MSLRDWLYEIPLIGGVIEAVDIWSEETGVAESTPDMEPDSSEEAGVAESTPDVDQYYKDLREKMDWTIVENTDLDTRNYLLEQTSEKTVKWDDLKKEVSSGYWTDLHGFSSSDPADFDIDHRVPFSGIVKEYYPEFRNLPEEEQLAIFNDQDNLQVLRDDHNREKGTESLEEYAPKICSEKERNKFLTAGLEYQEKLKDFFSGKRWS